jgi:hypothetical protein
MLKRKKIVLAVSAAAGVAAVTLAGTGQAGTILFPQIVESDTVTTVISVMNTGRGYDGGTTLHYRYYWKPWLSEANNADECTEVNAYLPTSKYDIQSMDIGGNVFGSQGRGVMFPDNSVNNVWNKPPVNYALGQGLSTPHRAYLLVDSKSGYRYGDLAGEAIVFEVDLGASWGYQAFQNRRSESYDFRRFASDDRNQVAFMPPDEVTTKFLVTALGRDMAPDSGVYDETTSVYLEAWDGNQHKFAQGVYDRDENFYSAPFKKRVTCIGAVDLGDWLPDSTIYDVVKNGGGWTTVSNVAEYPFKVLAADSLNGGDWWFRQNAAIFKVEYGTSVDGVDVGGIFNNGLYLHPDEHERRNNRVWFDDEIGGDDNSEEAEVVEVPAT